MNELTIILEELKKVLDQIFELTERINSLEYSIKLTSSYIRDIKRTVCPTNSAIDKYPDDEYLDKLEAEEHEKVMCTYPGNFEKNVSTENDDLLAIRK